MKWKLAKTYNRLEKYIKNVNNIKFFLYENAFLNSITYNQKLLIFYYFLTLIGQRECEGKIISLSDHEFEFKSTVRFGDIIYEIMISEDGRVITFFTLIEEEKGIE